MISKKVVHFTTVHPRSDGRIFSKQLRSLTKVDNLEVHLVVADGLGGMEAGKVQVHDIGIIRGPRFARIFIGSWQMWKRVRSLKPNVVHFHDPELIGVSLLLKLERIKVVYDVHEDTPRQIHQKEWLPQIIRRPIAWVVALAEFFAGICFDAIVAATPSIANRFPAKSTYTIHNFPIIKEFEGQSTTVAYAQRSRAVAYIGGITRLRGIAEMVEAIALSAQSKPVTLNLAGSFSSDALAHQTKQHLGWRFVEYFGYVGRQEVAKILEDSRAGLITVHPAPNHVNGVPIKMFEYMAAGLPIIASDFPSWRTLIENEKCGVLVDPMNPFEIARAITWIMENPRAAEAMGKNGRRAILESLNWHNEEKKLLRLYARLLSST